MDGTRGPRGTCGKAQGECGRRRRGSLELRSWPGLGAWRRPALPALPAPLELHRGPAPPAWRARAPPRASAARQASCSPTTGQRHRRPAEAPRRSSRGRPPLPHRPSRPRRAGHQPWEQGRGPERREGWRAARTGEEGGPCTRRREKYERDKKMTGGSHQHVAATSAKPHPKPPGWLNVNGFESSMAKDTRFWNSIAKIKPRQKLDGQK